jgi:hypothetical protein
MRLIEWVTMAKEHRRNHLGLLKNIIEKLKFLTWVPGKECKGKIKKIK